MQVQNLPWEFSYHPLPYVRFKTAVGDEWIFIRLPSWQSCGKALSPASLYLIWPLTPDTSCAVIWCFFTLLPVGNDLLLLESQVLLIEQIAVTSPQVHGSAHSESF